MSPHLRISVITLTIDLASILTAFSSPRFTFYTIVKVLLFLHVNFVVILSISTKSEILHEPAPAYFSKFISNHIATHFLVLDILGFLSCEHCQLWSPQHLFFVCVLFSLPKIFSQWNCLWLWLFLKSQILA